MSSDEKKNWKKPELIHFHNSAEILAYYEEHGTPEQVRAIQRLIERSESAREEKQASLRVAGKR